MQNSIAPKYSLLFYNQSLFISLSFLSRNRIYNMSEHAQLFFVLYCICQNDRFVVDIRPFVIEPSHRYNLFIFDYFQKESLSESNRKSRKAILYFFLLRARTSLFVRRINFQIKCVRVLKKSCSDRCIDCFVEAEIRFMCKNNFFLMFTKPSLIQKSEKFPTIF